MAVTINGTNGIETNTDTGKIKVGASDDLTIEHSDTGNLSSITHSGAGKFDIVSTGDDLNIKSSENVVLMTNDTELGVYVIKNGAVKLYHDNALKFETTSGGATVTGNLSATSNLLLADNVKARFGTGEDLQIFHDGSNSYVQDDGTGFLGIQGSEVRIRNTSGHPQIVCSDDVVELWYDNAKKIETYSEGIRVTGFVKAQQDSDSHWDGNSYNWSMFQVSENGNVVVFENSHDSAPFGNYIYFSDAAPDDHSSYFMQCDDNSATRFKVWSDGDVYTHDANILTSDETLKENITDATSKLEDLKKLKVRNFNWKSSFHPEKSKKKQLGFIAQEVEQVFPALVEEYDVAPGAPNDGHTPVMKKAIKAAWDPIIIKAMQELIAKVETLETKVAALEAA